jgi:hypothetical protein
MRMMKLRLQSSAIRLAGALALSATPSLVIASAAPLRPIGSTAAQVHTTDIPRAQAAAQKGGEDVNTFKVVILVHAVSSDWHNSYRVSTEFSSFERCETVRPELADDFRQFLERRHLQPFEVESKCVKYNDDI